MEESQTQKKPFTAKIPVPTCRREKILRIVRDAKFLSMKLFSRWLRRDRRNSPQVILFELSRGREALPFFGSLSKRPVTSISPIVSFHRLTLRRPPIRWVSHTPLTYPALWNVLSVLKKLETLSFTLPCQGELGVSRPETDELSLRSIKKLNVEAPHTGFAADVLIDMLNRCESIECIHINVIGVSWSEIGSHPRMLRERLRTLRTVIVTTVLVSSTQLLREFLPRIFDLETDRRFSNWQPSSKSSFIHHDGWLNGTYTGDEVECLKRIANITLGSSRRLADTLER